MDFNVGTWAGGGGIICGKHQRKTMKTNNAIHARITGCLAARALSSSAKSKYPRSRHTLFDLMFHKRTINAIVAAPKIQGATARYIGGLQNPKPVIPMTNGTAKPTAMFCHISVVMPNRYSDAKVADMPISLNPGFGCVCGRFCY